MPGYLTEEESAHERLLRAEYAKIVVPYTDRPWRDLTGEEQAERADALAKKRLSLVTVIPPDDRIVESVMAEFDALERAGHGSQPDG